MDNSSGVGVLDKAALVLAALEAGPATLANLVSSTGLARPTAHRLAVALEHHRMVSRDLHGRFILGPRLGEPRHCGGRRPLAGCRRPCAGAAAGGHRRECTAVPPARRPSHLRRGAERPTGLRDTIPVGATLTMLAGSAAQILLAWEEPERMHRGLQGARPRQPCSRLSAAGAGRRAWPSESLVWPRSPRRFEPRVGVSSPQCRCPARSSGSPASRAVCTLPPCSERPND